MKTCIDWFTLRGVCARRLALFGQGGMDWGAPVEKRKTAMRLALLIVGLGVATFSGGATILSDCAEARGCGHCYKLESKCRRESKGQANCDAIVARCLRQCRQGG